MRGEGRAVELAATAAGLAAGAGIDLPDSLALWRLAGCRPVAAPLASDDPAQALVGAMESSLTGADRRQGAHYTPRRMADRLARLAFDDREVTSVVDPACGAGSILLAGGDLLVARGCSRAEAVACLFGADIDPLAVAAAEAALALWSGGAPPPPGHVVVADMLRAGREVWPGAPSGGFDVVVGNPPFQGQLATDTARDGAQQAAMRARFGGAVTPYVDTAALFLLAAMELARDGGRIALVQPLSTAGARDAGGVRAVLAERARLVEVWVPDGRPFEARVHVCVPVLQVGTGVAADWTADLARGRGVPSVDLGTGPTVASLAVAVGGFRRHYYGLVGHVQEDGTGPRLVTSGAIGLGGLSWGERPIRFARASWARPTVDEAAVRASSPDLDRWLGQVLRAKVVLASQTRVLEAAPDVEGRWVPCTPVVSVIPHDPADAPRLAAALCAPPTSAWAAMKASGTGLSPGAIRTSTALALAAPLPADQAAWSVATEALVAGDLERYAAVATAMYSLPGTAAAAVLAWWDANCPLGPSGEGR